VVLLLNLNNAQKTHLVHIFGTLAAISFSCFVFQLPAVKLIEMLAHCANTRMETISAFIDSSIDNVLLQTNPDFTSRFLNSSTFLNVLC